jgi:hypothetical protein
MKIFAPLLAFALAFAGLAGVANARTTNICAEALPPAPAPTAGGVSSAPLIVSGDSHVVVMEYEAWFGPRAVNFQPDVTLCLQSSDMQPVGGGYDSADPAVITQHARWLSRMGVDAVTADLTNNVSCIFDGDNPAIIKQVCADPWFRAQQLNIRDNTGNLYPVWSALGTPLKIIPILGGFDPDALTPDASDGRQRTALQKEAEYFGAFMARFPNMNVIYDNKPLMLIYTGTPVEAARVEAIRDMLNASRLDRLYTFRLIAGYLDSQPSFWAKPNSMPNGPIEISPRWGFWSVVDRINFWGAPPAPYYPTYNLVASRVENLTVSIATAGQNGWNCATTPGQYSYCPDAALRYCGEGYSNGCDTGIYETLAEFMTFARSLKPTFLIIDQFNEFAQPDEGWNANTNDDVEPTRQWGYSAMRAIIAQVTRYRETVSQPRIITAPLR